MPTAGEAQKCNARQPGTLVDAIGPRRISRGKLELNLAEADLHAVLEQALAICRTEIELKSQVLDLDLRAKHHSGSMEPVWMQQVRWNLIRNATTFTPPTGAIPIRTWNGSPGTICVEVTDTGIGFEPDMVRKIFEPFEQGGRHITRQSTAEALNAMLKRIVGLLRK